MTPFNQVLRLWLRRAPLAERAFGAVAAVVVAGLLTWAAVPSDYEATTSVAAGAASGVSQGSAGTIPGQAGTAIDPATGAPVASATGGGIGGGGGGGGTTVDPVTGAPVGPGSSAGPVAAACPSGTDTGASDTELKVGVAIVDVAGAAGNGAFGLPSAGQQEAVYQVVADSMNASGGICGRQLAMSYYRVNALDSSATHAACLEMVADGLFFAIDNGAIGANELPCFAQGGTPYLSPALSAQARDFYPYAFTLTADDVVFRNAILAWVESADLGPDDTIGVIYHRCVPAVLDTVLQYFIDAGIREDQLSKFDMGPCTGFASPSTHQQAILQFQGDGVDVVFPAFLPGDFGTFTRIAQGQGFRPRYLIADYSVIATAYGALAPDWDNIDGALAITSQRVGEEHTPGFQPTDGTARCNEIMAAAGQPPVYQQNIGFGGIACSGLWFLQAMLEHAPTVSRAALAEGLPLAGSIPVSYPTGPGDFSQPGTVWGGQFFRPLQASAACRCFTVTDPTFRPSFP